MEYNIRMLTDLDHHHRTQDWINRLGKFTLNADTATCDFFSFGDPHKKLITHVPIRAWQSDVPLMAISHYHRRAKHDGEIALYYNPALRDLDDASLAKIIAHEMGHSFQTVGGFLPAQLAFANPIAEALSKDTPTKVVKRMVGALSGVVALHQALPAMNSFSTIIVGGLAGFAAAAALITYPSRLCEYNADDFADRMVPEITMGHALENAFDCVGHIPHKSGIFYPHPDPSKRFALSERNCATYAEHKAKHNIPSLIYPD